MPDYGDLAEMDGLWDAVRAAERGYRLLPIAEGDGEEKLRIGLRKNRVQGVQFLQLDLEISGQNTQIIAIPLLRPNKSQRFANGLQPGWCDVGQLGHDL